MRNFFSLTYFPYIAIFTIIWGNHLALKITIPYFIISIPFILSTIYLIGSSLIYFIDNKDRLLKKQRLQSIVYISILIYTVYTFVKLFFVESQQDFLRNTLYIIGAMYAVSGIMYLDNPLLLKNIHSKVLKYYPYIFIFIYLPLMNMGSSLVGILSFYIAMYPFLGYKRKWIAYFALIFVLSFPGQRMPLLQITVTIFLFLLFKYNILKNRKVISIFCTLLFLFPIVAFTLAVTNKYNILAIEQNSNSFTYGSENLVEDTRTLLYEESIHSAIENNYLIQGRTFGYGYDSFWQTKRVNDLHTNIVKQRNAEVFIINIFTWMGIIGIVIFAILFYWASQLAIKKSNNIYVRFIGILVTLQWIFCWIEYSLIFVNFNHIIMWTEIAICLSPYWRSLTNNEFKNKMRWILK